jgi:hypothetical protein
MKTSKLDARIVERARAAEQELEDARKMLGVHILDRAGLRLGRVARDKSTGDLYQLESVTLGPLQEDELQVTLGGRRVYKTRREPSKTISFFTLGTVEPYNPDAD